MAGLTDGLLAYWTFDNTATDASGNGNTLALNGGATFAQGLFGQGLSLDGQGGSYAVEVNTNPACENCDNLAAQSRMADRYSPSRSTTGQLNGRA
ncbi:hypothetical protein ACRQ5Q_42790 (plasmid) [Bradyrhizobium sp. PMVTL-01]|uniref:hypothetical protein n=1 Tax=Bradyrhizobium sp. PMVTL-01 TaxID=3434999 RepID=UPI003F72A941